MKSWDDSFSRFQVPIARRDIAMLRGPSLFTSLPECDGTVLDNSCLMFLSRLYVGRTHDNSTLPVVLAGGLESQDVQSIPFANGSDGRQPDHFGDSDSRLARI